MRAKSLSDGNDWLDGSMLGKVLRDRLIRAITRPPFRDELGRKGRFERIARAGPHLIRRLRLVIAGGRGGRIRSEYFFCPIFIPAPIPTMLRASRASSLKFKPSTPTSFFSVATLLTCSCSGLVECRPR